MLVTFSLLEAVSQLRLRLSPPSSAHVGPHTWTRRLDSPDIRLRHEHRYNLTLASEIGLVLDVIIIRLKMVSVTF